MGIEYKKILLAVMCKQGKNCKMGHNLFRNWERPQEKEKEGKRATLAEHGELSKLTISFLELRIGIVSEKLENKIIFCVS